MTSHAVPRFYLYGEPHRVVDRDFVHVESLDDRTRPNAWTIQPHAHAELAHIFVIEEGGGIMTAEDRAVACEAPCLVLVPPTVVHGFAWNRAASGYVITLSRDYFEELVRADPDLRPLFGSARAVPFGRDAMGAVIAAIGRLMRELGWSAVGRRGAVQASTLEIAVATLRESAQEAAPNPIVASPQAMLVARLHERIEQRFRLRESVVEYARALGVSTTTLRDACARVAGTSPMTLLDQRTLLEARRALLFSGIAIAEIGYALGFADPAYFSRFFSRECGVSPRAYRENAGRVSPS